jgi:hypothetical protein
MASQRSSFDEALKRMALTTRVGEDFGQIDPLRGHWVAGPLLVVEAEPTAGAVPAAGSDGRRLQRAVLSRQHRLIRVASWLMPQVLTATSSTTTAST